MKTHAGPTNIPQQIPQFVPGTGEVPLDSRPRTGGAGASSSSMRRTAASRTVTLSTGQELEDLFFEGLSDDAT